MCHSVLAFYGALDLDQSSRKHNGRPKKELGKSSSDVIACVCVCFVSKFFLPNCLFDPRLRHSAFKAFCSLFASAISIASAIIFHSDLTCLTKDHRRAGGVSANCFPPLLLRSREASVKKKKQTNKITNKKKSFVWNGAEWRSWNLEPWIWFCRSCLLVMMVIVIVLAALVERESRQDGNERHG